MFQDLEHQTLPILILIREILVQVAGSSELMRMQWRLLSVVMEVRGYCSVKPILQSYEDQSICRSFIGLILGTEYRFLMNY